MHQYVWDGVMHTERMPKEQPVSLQDHNYTSRDTGSELPAIQGSHERGLEQMLGLRCPRDPTLSMS